MPKLKKTANARKDTGANLGFETKLWQAADALRKYHSEKVPDADSWRHEKVTLKPVNLTFPPIELTEAEAGTVGVIAECVEVLGNS